MFSINKATSDIYFPDFWRIKGITEVNTDDFLLHNLQKKVFHGKKKSKNRMTEYGQIFKMESFINLPGSQKDRTPDSTSIAGGIQVLKNEK